MFINNNHKNRNNTSNSILNILEERFIKICKTTFKNIILDKPKLIDGIISMSCERAL